MLWEGIMEVHLHRYAWLPLVLTAAAGTLALTALLYPFLGAAIASTLGMGVGVGLAVYLDRRWLRPSPPAAREAFTYGAATAFGWALAQLIIHFW